MSRYPAAPELAQTDASAGPEAEANEAAFVQQLKIHDLKKTLNIGLLECVNVVHIYVTEEHSLFY